MSELYAAFWRLDYDPSSLSVLSSYPEGNIFYRFMLILIEMQFAEKVY